MNETRNLMSQAVITIDPQATVQAAAEKMTAHHLGALVVVQDGKLSGMFTERDVLDRVVSKGLDPKATPVSEVATAHPIAVKPETPIQLCYQLIKQHGFRHLPVVDEDGAPQGVLSVRDFFECLAINIDPDLKLEDACKELGKLSSLMEQLESLP